MLPLLPHHSISIENEPFKQPRAITDDHLREPTTNVFVRYKQPRAINDDHLREPTINVFVRYGCGYGYGYVGCGFYGN